MKIFLKLLPLVLFLATGPVRAVDGISVTAGTGEDADMAAVAVQWDWEKRWFEEGDWWLGGYWELDGSYWKGDGRGGDDIYGIGITPVFRLQRQVIHNVSPYVEIGIGAHLLSDKTVNDDKNIGTNFQFGDHVGAGIRFGQDLKYDLGYRYQHYSNAGLSSDNPGIDFHQFRLKYYY